MNSCCSPLTNDQVDPGLPTVKPNNEAQLYLVILDLFILLLWHNPLERKSYRRENLAEDWRWVCRWWIQTDQIQGQTRDRSETERRSITRDRRTFRQKNPIIQNPQIQIQSSNRVRQADRDRSRDRNWGRSELLGIWIHIKHPVVVPWEVGIL